MNKLLSVSLTVAILAITFSSCRKQHDESTKPDGQVKFSISALQLKNALESVSDSGVSTGITSVVVTIEDLEGNDIKSLEKIDLYNMNGYYISKPISLPTGGYKLNEFLVLNGMNQVVYAAPLTGSPKDNLVENPLPLSFTITKDSVTKLIPEVVSTTESNPSDFGYNTFSFEVAETFNFLVGAFVYNDLTKNFELTTASIKIWNDTSVVYSGALKANQSETTQLNYDSLGITNKITLPERYNNYILEITKPGYKIYCDTFSKEELRVYYRSEDYGPLVVVLEKLAYDLTQGLVAYYPFDGNVNDSSGNGHNASFSIYKFGTNRIGKANNALLCESNYDVVLIPGTVFSNYTQGTISMWIKTTEDRTGYTFWNSPCLFGADITGYNDSVFNIITQYGKIGIWGQLNIPGQDDKYNSNKKINDNQWHFIVVKINDNDSTKLFVDSEYLGSIPSKNPIANRQYAIMGSGPTQSDFHTGLVDDVRIYKRVLSQEEITKLYNE